MEHANRLNDLIPTRQDKRRKPSIIEAMLRNDLITDQSIEQLSTQDNLLMALPYNTDCSPSTPGIIQTGLCSLGPAPIIETWSVAGPVTKGVSGNCHWSKSADILAAAIWLSAADCQQLQTATEQAYIELLSLLQAQGYPHPLRFWNYIPDINLGAGDDERYKRFCTGRLNAFHKMHIPDLGFPSASALGHHGEGAVIYALAANVRGEHHNNSLQVNAYHYPREYGVSSPSFARATSVNIAQQDVFFISGTASIIGHQTMHEGDLIGQLETTIDNIQHLLDNNRPQNNPPQQQLQSLKVYLRQAADYAPARAALEKHFGNIPMLFTLADICRSNLLVEVECFCG